MDSQNEIWKDIKDYEGIYKISNVGNVKSLSRTIKDKRGNYKHNKEIILKSNIRCFKYLHVNLRKNGKSTGFSIHRLVALNFIENKENKECVNHIDNNTLNNHVSNLEWVTKRENSCHGRYFTVRTSKYIGVHFDINRNNWQSTIRHNKKRIYLGRFKTEIEAYNARCEYEKENNIINKYL